MESLRTRIYFLVELCDQVNTELANIITALLLLSCGSRQGQSWEHWQTYIFESAAVEKFFGVSPTYCKYCHLRKIIYIGLFPLSFENRNLLKVSIRNKLVKKHTYEHLSRIRKLHFLIILFFIMRLLFTSFNNLKSTEKQQKACLQLEYDPFKNNRITFPFYTLQTCIVMFWSTLVAST